MPQVRAIDNRIRSLDSLRGIAALSVVLLHYTANYDRKYGHTGDLPFYVPWGGYGVSLFFVISGFVIFMTVERSARVRDFALSRFTRLFPVYWAAVLLTWVVVQLAGPDNRQVGFKQMLVNLTMMQSWAGVRTVDRVYWTLAIELTFYVGIAIALALGLLKGRRIANCLIAWLGVSLLLRSPLVDGLPGASYLELRTDATVSHLFVAGICFYLAYSRGWSAWPAAGVLVAIPIGFLGGLEEGLFTLGIVALFAGAMAGWLPFLSWRPLAYLGLISYALYLTHQNIGYASLDHLERAGVPALLAVVISLVGALGIAAALTFGWERPVASRIRTWARSRGYFARARRAAVPGPRSHRRVPAADARG